MTMAEYFRDHPNELITFKCCSRSKCIAVAAAIETIASAYDYTDFDSMVAESVVANADDCRCATSDRYAVVATMDKIFPYIVVTTGRYFAEADAAFHEKETT